MVSLRQDWYNFSHLRMFRVRMEITVGGTNLGLVYLPKQHGIKKSLIIYIATKYYYVCI